jgi:uncharacterized protein
MKFTWITLALALLGGLLAHALHVPLAFLVGPTVAVALARRRWPSLGIPVPLRTTAMVVAGTAIGAAVQADLTLAWQHWALSVAAMLVYVSMASWLGRQYLQRVAGYPETTALLAAQPGGILVMMSLAESVGAPTGRVMFAHAMRVASGPLCVAVLLSWAGYPVPFSLPAHVGSGDPMPWQQLLLLAGIGVTGYGVARLVRMPAAELLGPILLSLLAVQMGWVSGSVPLWPMVLALGVAGAAVGATFPRVSGRQLLSEAFHSLMALAIFLGVAWAFGLLIAHWADVHPVEFFLAASPSGLTEMPAIAVLLGKNAAYVAVIETVRFLSCAVLASWQVKRYNASRILSPT